MDMPDWKLNGLCLETEPDEWFPEGVDREDEVERLQEICAECPVQVLCMQYAIQIKVKDGIWGGRDFFKPVYVRKRVRTRTPRPTDSEIPGVSYDSRRKVWVVRIRTKGVDYYGGSSPFQNLAEQKAIGLRKKIMEAWGNTQFKLEESVNA